MKPQNYLNLSADEQRGVIRDFWNRFNEIPYSIIENIARKHTLVNDVIYSEPSLVRELVTEYAFDIPEIAEEILTEAAK
jgi:hypothetical protein